jgi:hypothetical protein
MLSTGPILNGGGSSLTGGLSVEKCRGMELCQIRSLLRCGMGEAGGVGVGILESATMQTLVMG